jgi:hypothetical protein
MLLIFSVVIVIIPVSLSSTIFVLNPGLFFILMSDFRTPLSTSNSFAILITISTAPFLSKSSEKFSKRASIISSPLKP